MIDLSVHNALLVVLFGFLIGIGIWIWNKLVEKL